MITLHYLKPTHSHALLVLWVLSLISFYVEPSHKQEQSSTLKIYHSRQYVICSQALEYVYIQKNTFIIRAVSRVFLGKPLFQKRLSFFSLQSLWYNVGGFSFWILRFSKNALWGLKLLILLPLLHSNTTYIIFKSKLCWMSPKRKEW